MALHRSQTQRAKEFIVSELITAVRLGKNDDVTSILQGHGHNFDVQDILNTASERTVMTSSGQRTDQSTALIEACQKASFYATASVTYDPQMEKDALEIVRLLLDHGADPNVKALSQSKEIFLIPLHMAVEESNLKLTRILLESKALVNQRDDVGRSALHICCLHKYPRFDCENLTILKTLIKYKADVNLQDKNNETPLHHSLRGDNCHLAMALLKKGTSVSIPDNTGEWPLHRAIKCGNINLVRKMLECKASVNQTNHDGQSALHLCFSGPKKCLETLTTLIGYKADVNLQDVWGNSPLHLAVRNSALDEANALMNCKADVNLQDKNGQTPLHLSIEYDTPDLMVALFENGALATIRDNAGNCTLDLAFSNLNFEKFMRVFELCATSKGENIELICETLEVAALRMACPDSFEYLRWATLLRRENCIPKRTLEPMKCYGFRREWETIEELETYKGDENQLKFQAILAREKIHQGQYEKLMELVQDNLISAVFAACKSDAGELLQHHLEIWRSYRPDGDRNFLLFYEVIKAWAKKIEEHFELFDTVSIVKLIQVAIGNLPEHLILDVCVLPSITSLFMKLYMRNRQVENSQKNERMLVKELLQQLLGTQEDDDPVSLQHLMTVHNFDSKYETIGMKRVRGSGVMKVLLDSGFELNALDRHGNTMLHTAMQSILGNIFIHMEPAYIFTSRVADQWVRTIKLLLDKGVYPHARNNNNEIARDILCLEIHDPSRFFRRRICDILRQYEHKTSMTLKHMACTLKTSVVILTPK